MKTPWKSVKITIAFCVFFSVLYILVLWIFTQFTGPNRGNAGVSTLNGKAVGAANAGQMFTENIYFWGWPSCTGGGYNASSSTDSNKGLTNEEYLAEVEARIDTFLLHHPYSQRRGVPAETVTASALGLDPDITPASARVQAKCVAEVRGTDGAAARGTADKTAEKPLLGLFGTAKVDVLKLNTVLEKINGKQ